MELTRIWEIIRRRKWVVIQALIVVSLAAVIASYLITPSYQASSKILMMKAKKDTIDPARTGLSSLSSIFTASSDVDVNKVLAACRPYMEKMVFRLQLRDEEGNLVNGDELTQTGAVSTIMEKIFPEPYMSISQYQGTDILQIKAASPHPQEAMMMANTLAEVMVAQNQIQVRAEYESARIFLEDQMHQVKDRYDTALTKITDFKKQQKTLDLEIETRMAAEKMAELLQEKEDNVIDLAEANAKFSRLKQHLATQKPAFLSASTLKENPHIEVLKKRLTELNLQLSQATSGLTERHPRVQSLREQIKMAEAELKKEIAVYRSSAPGLIELQRQIASLEAHLDGVNADIEKYFMAFGDLPDKVYEQADLDMELNVAQQSYSSLLDSLYQIGMAQATTLSEIRIVEPAVRPFSPMSPKKMLNGVLGLFVGLLFGTGLAFAMEYRDDTIRTADDVKQFRPIALMGTVPRFKLKRPCLISAKDANDPLYESYRRIRNYPTIDEEAVRSLLITSAGPEEGKSTTAVNLGVSFTRQAKKVLIDSDQMGQLIADLKTRFDVVIIDSAPMFVKSDALVMAKYVDGSIIVLASEKTTRRAVNELLDVLTKAHIEPLGFVLNRFAIDKGKYFYHQYYYGHYSTELSVTQGTC